MQVEFVGFSAQDGDNKAANTSRLVNCYRTRANGSETQWSLQSVLGRLTYEILDAVFIRAFDYINGQFYVITGGTAYGLSEVNSTYTNLTAADGTIITDNDDNPIFVAGSEVPVLTDYGSVTDSAETSIAGNNGDLAIAAGGTYYVITGGAVTTPATGNFSSIGSVDYLAGYTIYTQKDGRKWGWSDVLDATSLPALNFATAEANDDDCLRVFAIRGNAWLFKERSIEIWYPTGQSGADAFLRLSGGVISTGLRSYNLITRITDGVFFIGDDDTAYLATGNGLTPVSTNTSAVSYSIVYENPRECFYYEDEDHKFCVITFEDRPAWVFDMVTQEWHERDESDTTYWTATHSTQGAYGWYSAHTGGEIALMSRVNRDSYKPLTRRAVSKVLYLEGKRFRIPLFELFGSVGTSDLDRDAQCWIRTSRDRGQTWGQEKWRSVGALGEYDKRMVWRSLGQFRQANVELGWSDPAEISFNAIARLEVA